MHILNYFRTYIYGDIYTHTHIHIQICIDFLGGSDGKESAYNVGDLGLIPGLGRFPGGGHGNPLQYSCPENSHGQRAWWAKVCQIAKSWTQLSD